MIYLLTPIVILNEVKNLFTLSGRNQILRNAQDDTLIGNFYFNTPTCFFIFSSTPTRKLLSTSSVWGFVCSSVQSVRLGYRRVPLHWGH